MSWLFSRALVAASSPASCLGGEPSAQLNVMPTQQPFLRNGKTTAFSGPSQFGLTCERLTEDRGAALLTLYLAGFPARTSAQPEMASASKASEADSGAKWRGSFARFDRDSCSWKTAQCSLLADSGESLEIWPRWGSMRNGACYPQPPLARRTYANASGYWPTPRACSAMAATITPESVWNHNRFPNLETVVGRRMWPTPTASTGGMEPEGKTGRKLETVVRWPTPTVAMHKGSSMVAITRKTGRSRAGDRLDYATERGEIAGGRLNPTWVEWLMGWPIGWTALKPLETGKSRSAPPKRGGECLDALVRARA